MTHGALTWRAALGCDVDSHRPSLSTASTPLGSRLSQGLGKTLIVISLVATNRPGVALPPVTHIDLGAGPTPDGKGKGKGKDASAARPAKRRKVCCGPPSSRAAGSVGRGGGGWGAWHIGRRAGQGLLLLLSRILQLLIIQNQMVRVGAGASARQ